MAAFIYLCPKTGLKVQGWIADGPNDANVRISVDCPVCSSVHLVNPELNESPGEEEAAT
jgi:hypothetical protein